MRKILYFLFGFFIISLHQVSAHVGYVSPGEVFENQSGGDWFFLLSPLFNLNYIFLMLGTLIVVFGLYFGLLRLSFVKDRIKYLRERAQTYHDFIPWMLRLSLGIALLGAGTAGMVISPLLTDTFGLAFCQIVLGFMILAGFLNLPVLLASIVLFIFALSQDFYIFGNLEFLAIALVLIILGDFRPGVDDLFGLPELKALRPLRKYMPLILRIGVGVAMIFLAIYEKLLNPHLSAYVVEHFNLTSYMPVTPAMWVLGAGLAELFIGLFILIGFRTRLVSAIAFLVVATTFFFFKESVYSHVTLFGILSVLFTTGGGAYSVDRYLINKNKI